MDGEGVSYYDALNLDRRASFAEVEAAFHKVDEAFRDTGAGWEGEAANGGDLIREAYNVLSDQAQRNVYDVYGKRGLKAGNSVVPVRPLREQWLLYQQQRWPQDRYDLLVQSSDITVSCNASEATSCVLRGVLPDVWPVITGVGVDSVMRLDHSETVMGLVGCRMRLRNLFKPKKPLSGWLQVPMWVKIRASARNFVSLGLCAGKHATASVSFLRILSATTRAEHDRTSQIAVAAEIRLSAASSLQTRLSLLPSRASLEVGLAHSSPLTSGYAGVAYGSLGTTATVRLSRAGHSLHLPLHLSDHYQDWRTLLVAVTLPLTVNLVATQFIIKPIMGFVVRAHAAEERKRLAEQIAAARKHALRQQAVMGARVARLAASDAKKTGFRVIKAAFGHLDGFRSLLEQQACKCDTGGCVRSAVEGALESCDSDSEWIDATTSMHLLVLDGKLWIRSGRDKSQLCGLADLHPGGTNDLYVLYMWQDQYYEVQVSGDEELRLPLRKATPLSGKWASLAQVLSCGAEVEQAAPEAPVPSGSNSGSVHDENKAPANGSATVASHTVKLESAES